MTKLECHVTECASNADNCCCRTDVKVSGPCACGSEQTCCASFLPKPEDAQNAAYWQQPNPSIPVACNAQGCAHNHSGHCEAASICINNCTGRAGTMDATQCSSFSAI